jgi:Relaxase/Mobilisation nuclease domain
MILKIILGSGARGLLSYISQFSKAPVQVHRPQNDPNIYGHLHLPDSDWHPSRGAQPTAAINQLHNLSFLDVVHNPGPNAANHRIHRIGQGSGEVFLPVDALHHLERGPAGDAAGLRRPGHRPGATSSEKRGGRLEKASAPPTFSTFSTSTPRQIAAEFSALRKLKPKLGKAVAHLILSPGPEDRALSKDEWKRALNLALAEHGATDAPHAAYLHDDTDHQHLHVFYSRITLSGEVINDSHSYQKNRSATQKITQELQLIPLPTTPNPTAPGNREALTNARRRAERNGTPDPTRIDAKAVREALALAGSFGHFQQVLAENADVESGFDRRGKDRQIYGWRLRRRGASEWIKASTLAKDLSWPKIAHRFSESDLAEEMPSQEPAAPVAEPVKVAVAEEAHEPTAPLKMQAAPEVGDIEDRYARAPASIRQLLRDGHAEKQKREREAREPQEQRPAQGFAVAAPLATKESAPPVFGFGLTQKIGPSHSLYVATCFAIADLAYEITRALASGLAAFVEAILSFLRRLLAFFGLTVNENALQNQNRQQTNTAQNEFELHELEPPPLLDYTGRDEKASIQVAELTAALRANNPQLLPNVDGAEAQKEALTILMLGPVPVTQALGLDDLGLLNISGTEFFEAAGALVRARQKPDCGVMAANQKLKTLEDRLAFAQWEHSEFKKTDRALFHIYTPPSAAKVEETQRLVEKARAALAAAKKQQEQAPVPAAPVPVRARLDAARVAFERDSLAVVSGMKSQAALLTDLKLKKLALTNAGLVAAALDTALRAHIRSEFLRGAKAALASSIEIAAGLAEIERLARQQKVQDHQHQHQHQHEHQHEVPELQVEAPEKPPRG